MRRDWKARFAYAVKDLLDFLRRKGKVFLDPAAHRIGDSDNRIDATQGPAHGKSANCPLPSPDAKFIKLQSVLGVHLTDPWDLATGEGALKERAPIMRMDQIHLMLTNRGG